MSSKTESEYDQKMDQITDPVPTGLNHDNTGWVHITGLKARTKYFYELVIPGSTVRTDRGGSFRTLPDGRDFVDGELNPEGLFNGLALASMTRTEKVAASGMKTRPKPSTPKREPRR